MKVLSEVPNRTMVGGRFIPCLTSEQFCKMNGGHIPDMAGTLCAREQYDMMMDKASAKEAVVNGQII